MQLCLKSVSLPFRRCAPLEHWLWCKMNWNMKNVYTIKTSRYTGKKCSFEGPYWCNSKELLLVSVTFYKVHVRDFEYGPVTQNSWVYIKLSKAHWEQIDVGNTAAVAWQIENTSHTGHSFKRLWCRRKIQINYKSFFKKLLRFSFWNILLKCTGSRGLPGGKNPLGRLLSWLQKIFFLCIYIKQWYPPLRLFFCFFG